MQDLREREIGVLFWPTPDPKEILPTVASFGVRCAQLGIGGDLDLGVAPAWKKALADANLRITTVCAAYNGEDYGYSDSGTHRRFYPRRHTSRARGAHASGQRLCRASWSKGNRDAHWLRAARSFASELRRRSRTGSPDLRPCRETQSNVRTRNRPGSGAGAPEFHSRC